MFRDTDSGARLHCHEQAVWVRVEMIRHITDRWGSTTSARLPIMVNIEFDAGHDS